MLKIIREEVKKALLEALLEITPTISDGKQMENYEKKRFPQRL